MKVYIAGPYSPRDTTLHGASQVAQRNVDRAIEAFHRLKKLGHIPFVPHLTHYIHIHPSSKEDYYTWWYKYDFSFLTDWADAIYLLDGWEDSEGSKMEWKLAGELGLTIMFQNQERGEELEKEIDIDAIHI